MKAYFYLIMISALFSCIKNESIDYSSLPVQNEDGSLNAIISCPAGNTALIYFENGKFVEQKNNINYLPLPFHLVSENNHKGILIASQNKQGAVVKSKRVGSVSIIDNGEKELYQVYLPTEKSNQLFEAENLQQLFIDQPAVRYQLELWLTNHKGLGKIKFDKWDFQ